VLEDFFSGFLQPLAGESAVRFQILKDVFEVDDVCAFDLEHVGPALAAEIDDGFESIADPGDPGCDLVGAHWSSDDQPHGTVAGDPDGVVDLMNLAIRMTLEQIDRGLRAAAEDVDVMVGERRNRLLSQVTGAEDEDARAAGEFASMREEVRRNLDQCRWMILPAKENPTGAAQGALAMEIATTGDSQIAALVSSLNHETTFSEATREREILSSWGGGCHQKIGVTVLSRPYGTIVSLRGLTDAGEVLDRFDLETERKTPRTTRDKVWPVNPRDDDWMSREPLEVSQPNDDADFWVARAEALPVNWNLNESRLVWTAGLKTWKRLAKRGVWVNGSAEGLGEDEDPRAGVIAGRATRWVKLTHERTEAEQGLERLATYRLLSSGEPPDLTRYTHFFWTSGSRFLDAVERQPEILDRWHACAPGNTWKIVGERLGSKTRLDVWLSHEDWLKDVIA